MTSTRLVWLITGGLASLALVALLLAQLLTRPAEPIAPVTSPAEARRGAAPLAHIRSTLFYAAADGDRLSPVVREVSLAEKVDDQGAEIVNIALQAPRSPLLPAIPAGTTLRGFYVTADGDAFVDLSGKNLTTSRGGTTAESLAVYAIVNSVTANLPTVKRVQILIEGKEVDTLYGHLDLRRPLTANMALVQ
jgi:spore germination protein GerM